MSEKISQTILESIRNIPKGYKHFITATSISLMLTLSSCWEKKQEVPQKLGDFERVDTKKEGWEKWNIYKYNLKKWEYPFTVWWSFNTLDSTNGDLFASVGTKNILDKNKKEIKDKQVFQVGETIYIKAKINKERESEYIYSFDTPENYSYRSQREQGSVKKIEKEIVIDGKKQKITLIKDAGLTFYVVQESDFFPGPMEANWTKIDHCIDFEKIIKKLSQIEEYEYLKEKIYQRSKKIGKDKILLDNKLTSFNINPTDIEDISITQIRKGNLLLPVPTPESKRSMDIQEFAYYAQQAIQEMENHPYYWPVIKEVLTKATREEILEELLTFAYSESSPYHERKIGKFELHRWEWNHKVFSFSYFHILMTKWSPWYKARINLWLSEGECYHPKNATKLFLAFRAEKAQEMSKPLSNFFPLRNDMYEKVARTYNWLDYKKYHYDTKMKDNHETVMRKLKKYKK